MTHMQALGYSHAHQPPELVNMPMPQATGHDLLVEIKAIAINPVDTKVKAAITEKLPAPKVIGWDAVGTVIATGNDVELFKAGDKVYYAGDMTRPGCYASHQLVDERIVGYAPTTLSIEQIAAMPLTTITAWEALFSRLRINPDMDEGKTILMIGGAGGVGSIAIQLAQKIARLNVVATASRSESAQWCLNFGADFVINHHSDITAEYRGLRLDAPDYILCLNNTDQHFSCMADLIAPQGTICSIVGTREKHDLDCLKAKSAGFVWEFMFTRPMFQTKDLIAQHQLLNTVSQLLDEGVIKSTLNQVVGNISAKNIEKAHQQLLSGTTLGKLVLTAPVTA